MDATNTRLGPIRGLSTSAIWFHYLRTQLLPECGTEGAVAVQYSTWCCMEHDPHQYPHYEGQGQEYALDVSWKSLPKVFQHMAICTAILTSLCHTLGTDDRWTCMSCSFQHIVWNYYYRLWITNTKRRITKNKKTAYEMDIIVKFQCWLAIFFNF